MEMEAIRQYTLRFIYLITTSIILIIFAYIIFDLIGLSNSYFFDLIRSAALFFINPFFGTISANLSFIPSIQKIHVDGMISIFAYLFFGLFIGELVTAFMYEKFRDVVQNFIDAIFKLVSISLFLRILLDLFSAYTNASMFPKIVELIYWATDWSTGLISSLNFFGLVINVSSIICLIIIVVIDSQFEKLLDIFFDYLNFGNNKVNFIRPIHTVTKKIVYIIKPNVIKRIFIKRRG